METRDCKFVNYRGRSRARSIYSPINSQHVIWDQKPEREGNEVAARAPASRSDRFQRQYCNRNLPINAFSSFGRYYSSHVSRDHILAVVINRSVKLDSTNFVARVCRECICSEIDFVYFIRVLGDSTIFPQHRLAFAHCNKVLAKACRGNMRLCTTIKRQIQRECESRYQSRMNPSRIPS